MHLSELGLEKKDVAALKKKHVHTADDLLRRFPRDYRDYRAVLPIQACTDGMYHAVFGAFNSMEVKKGAKMTYLRLSMVSNGQRFRVDFFVGKYAYYLQRIYMPLVGKDVVVTGKVSIDPLYGYSVTDAEIYEVSKFRPGIHPVYPKNGTMDMKVFMFWLRRLMEMQGEILEKEIREKAGLMGYREALYRIHCPRTMEDIQSAERQFAFYDLLWFELRRRELEADKPNETGIKLIDRTLMDRFIEKMPYSLTKRSEEATREEEAGQADVLKKLAETAASGKRIEAVIEGDVGCGKTAVATALSMLAAGNGYQTVIMAPKTVLAGQHAREIGNWCSELGIEYEVLAGAPKNAEERKQRKDSVARIKDGTARVIIGTHSCFSKDVAYKNIGLIIIDEEQQFGVEQKSALREKALLDAHYVEMSATPVPRSLALSVYGNREIYRITVKPGGRKPVQTAACSTDAPVFRFMEKQLSEGRQCYVVVPAIDENEDEGISGVKKTAEKYRKQFGPLGYEVTMADGRMKDEEFSRAIDAFRENRAQILVATTVVEVGVNVPNASVIVIENAERFGLSQMHQLRGRVGRREYPSYCILLTQDKNNERIKTMETIADGFTIAEKDLLMRGPGDVNGMKQSGQNKYITEALIYPDIHKKAAEAAAMCTEENRYAMFLKAAYKEHLKYEEEKR